MGVRIIIGSSADLPYEEAKKEGIYYLPMTVRFEEEEYQDGINLSHQEFYQKLIESDVLPKTSQITPYAFEEVYKEIRAAGDEAVVICISAKLSGTYESACQAAKNYPEIYVVDSKNACIGEQLLVREGMTYVKEGKSAKEIQKLLTKAAEEVCTLALLDTLEYLKKGGRISAMTAFAGGLLSIKPVIAVEEGEVRMLGKARGSKQGNNLLMEMVKEKGGIDFNRPFLLGYSGLSDMLLKKYIEDSRSLWENQRTELPCYSIGSTIGTHVGPGAVAFAFFPKGE